MSNESFFDKVKDFVKGHPEQADQGLDKVGEFLDERTGGQYSEHIAKGDALVREQFGIPDDAASVPTPEPAPAPGDPPAVPGDPTPTPGTTPEPPTVPHAHRADHDAAGSQPRPGADVAARVGARGRAGHVERAAGAASLRGPTDRPLRTGTRVAATRSRVRRRHP